MRGVAAPPMDSCGDAPTARVTAVAQLQPCQPATARLDAIAWSGLYKEYTIAETNKLQENRLFTPDVQNNAIRLHACTQSCCPVGLVDDAVQKAFPRISDSLLQVVDVLISL